MPTFGFEPSESVSSDVLQAKSTFAKVAYKPMEVYHAATLEAPEGRGTAWKATCDFTPNYLTHPDETATLYITKGEFGKILGTFDLGRVRG